MKSSYDGTAAAGLTPAAFEDFRAQCRARIRQYELGSDQAADPQLDAALEQAARAVRNYASLASPRRFVIVDLIVSVGARRFADFIGVIRAIERSDFTAAAEQLAGTVWCARSRQRAARDIEMMRTGEWFAGTHDQAVALLPQAAGDILPQAAGDPPQLPDREFDVTPGNYLTVHRGVFDDTTPAQLDAAFSAYEADASKQRLVLNFHGGLVDRHSGLNTANILYKEYESASAYPLFFIWESGILDVLRDVLSEIGRETSFNRFKTLIAGFLQAYYQPEGQISPQASIDLTISEQQLAHLAVENIDETRLATMPPPPDEAFAAFAASVERDPIVARELDIIAATAIAPLTIMPQSAGIPTVRASGRTLMSPSVVAAIAAQRAERAAFQPFGLDALIPSGFVAGGAVASIAERVIQRFRAGRDHGITCTLVEEIIRAFYLTNAGQAVWQSMKTSTAAAFGAGPQYAGTAVMQRLVALFDRNVKPNFTLFGHSAGSIYICNFLAAADAAFGTRDVKFDVVFMAPAATDTLFAKTLGSYAHRLGGFRCFTMHDAFETADQLVGPVYPRSLLYFISGCLEGESGDEPLVGMERFCTAGAFSDPLKFPDVKTVRDFLYAPGRTFFSETGAGRPGETTMSHHHGGFPTDVATNDSNRALLENGVPRATAEAVSAGAPAATPFALTAAATVTPNAAPIADAQASLVNRYLQPAASFAAFAFGSAAASPLPHENVVGVGIGAAGETDVLQVLVRTKYDPSKIPENQLLPDFELGHAVKVIEVGTIVPFETLPRQFRARPLTPGTSIGPRSARIAGSLGAIVRDASGQLYLLSNNHVLANQNRLVKGEAIVQAAMLDGGDAVADVVGTLWDFIPLPVSGQVGVDCALAKLDPSIAAQNQSVFANLGTAVRPRLGMKVSKFGRTSMATTGVVSTIGTTVKIAYEIGEVTLTDQFFVTGDPDPVTGVAAPFSQPGDSGALIVTKNGEEQQPVGLLVGGSAVVTAANDVANVLQALKVTF